MVLSKEDIVKEALFSEVRAVAGNFANLIIQRHIEWRKTGVDYTAESLIAGTKYADALIIMRGNIIYKTPGRIFVWKYIPRDEDETANLIEVAGFN
jgi:hypothetical protein